MVVTTLYVVRHGFRASIPPPHRRHGYGHVAPVVPSPTGNPADPPVTSHGLRQAEELAEYIAALNDSVPIRRIYTSPFVRCLQTVAPCADKLGINLICAEGLGEWFGTAPFPSPPPAPLPVLRSIFPELTLTSHSSAIPALHGESVAQLHDRCARAVTGIIADAEARSTSAQPEALLLCTHAAVVIALGRALTGRRRPEEWVEGDFDAFTCGVSKFVRRYNAGTDDGVSWICEVNSGIEHLSTGGERNWHFSGEESFMDDADGGVAFDQATPKGSKL